MHANKMCQMNGEKVKKIRRYCQWLHAQFDIMFSKLFIFFIMVSNVLLPET